MPLCYTDSLHVCTCTCWCAYVHIYIWCVLLSIAQRARKSRARRVRMCTGYTLLNSTYIHIYIREYMRIYIYENEMYEFDTCECAAALTALKEQEKAERGEAFDGKLNSWDFNYYHTLLKQRKYTIDEDEVCTYFKLTTFSKLLLLLLLPHAAQNAQTTRKHTMNEDEIRTHFKVTTSSKLLLLLLLPHATQPAQIHHGRG